MIDANRRKSHHTGGRPLSWSNLREGLYFFALKWGKVHNAPHKKHGKVQHSQQKSHFGSKIQKYLLTLPQIGAIMNIVQENRNKNDPIRGRRKKI